MNIHDQSLRRRRHTIPLILAAAGTVLAACDDDPVEPGAVPTVDVQASADAFPETELAVGTDARILIEVHNAGEADLVVSAVDVSGADADHFEIVDGDFASPVPPGATREIAVAFVPMSEGVKSAAVTIMTNDPRRGRVEVPLTGEAARFRYRQVDRMGIPGLNTVFNHPSGVGPFDKTAYNLASPADDIANYTELFEVVLGAVGSPDPSATAALLLPDALPVSLAAATTSFAMLTGRALADDAVDVALAVTVGVAALQSDNVDTNDVPFRSAFPYVAPPHE